MAKKYRYRTYRHGDPNIPEEFKAFLEKFPDQSVKVYEELTAEQQEEYEREFWLAVIEGGPDPMEVDGYEIE